MGRYNMEDEWGRGSFLPLSQTLPKIYGGYLKNFQEKMQGGTHKIQNYLPVYIKLWYN